MTPGRNWKIRLPLTLSAVCPKRRKLIEFSCYHRQVRDIISTLQHKWERAALKTTSSCQVISHLCKTGRFLYRVFLLRLSNMCDITTTCNMAADSTELLTLVQQFEKVFVKVFPCFFSVCIFVTFTCFRSDLFNQKLHYTAGMCREV